MRRHSNERRQSRIVRREDRIVRREDRPLKTIREEAKSG
jgi:hypothetical protein